MRTCYFLTCTCVDATDGSLMLLLQDHVTCQNVTLTGPFSGSVALSYLNLATLQYGTALR